jgi:hypothetical protein
MVTPIQIGLESPEQEKQLIAAVRAASLQRLKGEPEVLPALMPSTTHFRHERTVQPLSRRDLLTDLHPAIPAIENGAGPIHFYPAAPYAYSHLMPGKGPALFGAFQAKADAGTGLMELRATCTPHSSNWVDNAHAELGQILTVSANQRVKITFSFTAETIYHWDFSTLAPNYHLTVNLHSAILCDLWKWDAKSGKTTLVNTSFSLSTPVTLSEPPNGITGIKQASLLPGGWSNLIAWAEIEPQAAETTYCVVLRTWVQANSGVGAIDLRLQLLQPT